MKIYQVDFGEQTIISKFVDTPTVKELEINQFITEKDAEDALHHYLEAIRLAEELEELGNG